MRESGELQVLVVERVLVDDDDAALAQQLQVGDERGRVHCDKHVARVARRQDVGAAEPASGIR